MSTRPPLPSTTSSMSVMSGPGEIEYGVYGRVLFCGQLEKRRDGAVRGGWASRLFVLTPETLHYYRKATEFELLGEERGHIALSSITRVRAMPEDEAPYSTVEPGVEHYYLEICTEDRLYLMRTPIREASTCESWSIAIEEQRKVLRSGKANQRECLSSSVPFPEALPSPTLLARNHELFSHFVKYKSVLLFANEQEASPPRVAMVSVVHVSERDARPAEKVIKRRTEWGEKLDLGVIPQGGACVILLQDGGLGRIGTQALMSSWDSGRVCWIEVTDAEFPTEIEVSVTCKVLSQETKLKSPKPQNSQEGLPKWVEWVDEGSSIGFLLMCLFVHLLYGVDGFHWSHKCCLTVGAALAISTILNGSTRNPPTPAPTPRHSSPTNLLPRLQFTLTVHRCRIKMEGTEYIYPQAISGKK
ncbi:SEC14 cytosolic factor [Phytophthora palmivora]|uniref:SEC14 cytosolic factor n=1 Tax=Phytophthora palmivora TaxID=4796 RepID=A0A2P4YU17_9STRA|nr:SEC14 cytosolic factor [Phytophthora palmivora]